MTQTTKVVAITGASSGIGEATARRLAAGGHRVFLGARRTGRLERLVEEVTREGGTAAFRKLDVTDAADTRAFVDAALAEYGRVDAVVNNAGLMPLSPLAALKTEEWNRMIDVNVRGVLHGIAAALPAMRAQGGGHFVNIASVGAYEVSPTAAVYCATKFAVRAISEGLRQESAGDIRVTLVVGGPDARPSRCRAVGVQGLVRGLLHGLPTAALPCGAEPAQVGPVVGLAGVVEAPRVVGLLPGHPVSVAAQKTAVAAARPMSQRRTTTLRLTPAVGVGVSTEADRRPPHQARQRMG